MKGGYSMKRIILASIAVFISMQAMDFIVHSMILMKTYESLAHVWRSDMMEKMWIMYVSSIIFSFLFTYIFTKGYENKGVPEGIRYGFLIGLFMNVVGMLNQYVVYPLPFSLVIKWFIYGLFEYIIFGIIVSLIYQPVLPKRT
jgi:hypothetical protein